MAGMATPAPTGAATSPPSTRAASQGTPAPTARAETDAPTAAKAIWHNDTCPDIRTRTLSEANRIT